MRRHTILVLVVSAALAAAGSPASDDDGPVPSWPSFRGPRAAGVAGGPAPPTKWNLSTGENVLWKTAIAGMGFGAPVVWGDRVFVTTAVGQDADPPLKVGLYGNIESVEGDGAHEWKVYALDRATGEILWERTAHDGVPRIRRHTKASHANSTAATNGERVVAFFGSEGLHCYDMNGEHRWSRYFGVLDSGFFRVPEAQWGFGSSPVIHGDKVIIQADVQQGSFLAALRLDDGKTVWRKERDDVPTWSTPTIVESGGRSQVVVNGFRHIGGYDLETGKELWKLRGGGDIPVPTPVFGQGLIFITNAHGGEAPIYAIRPSAAGEITLEPDARSNEHIAWSDRRSGSYMQTPLLYGEHLYVCRDNGVLSVFDAATGERLSQKRLGSGSTGFTASAVAANGMLYYTSEVGDVLVVRAGAAPEVVATNELDEICMATPAICGGTLFFRTKGHVVAVGRKIAPPRPS